MSVVTVEPETYSYVFSSLAEPVCFLASGDIVDLQTEDAFESRIRSRE